MSEHQLQRVSYDVEDFVASGIYPGGTNLITDAKFVLWDYNNTRPPQSECAVMLTCQPTDGSNNNELHEEYWNIGPSKDFVPGGDGRHLLGTRKITNSCNAFHFFNSLRANCGMERGRVTTEEHGIKALVGSTITFIRMPVKREFRNNPNANAESIGGGGGGGGTRQSEVLVASKASFSWEGGKVAGVKATSGRVAGMAAATAPAVTPATESNGSNPLTTTLLAILSENDGAVETKTLAAMVTEKLSVVQGIGAAKRVQYLKTVNDPAKLSAFAAENGMELDTENGVLLVAS